MRSSGRGKKEQSRDAYGQVIYTKRLKITPVGADIICVLTACLCVALCSCRRGSSTRWSPDPHRGMLYVGLNLIPPSYEDRIGNPPSGKGRRDAQPGPGSAASPAAQTSLDPAFIPPPPPTTALNRTSKIRTWTSSLGVALFQTVS